VLVEKTGGGWAAAKPAAYYSSVDRSSAPVVQSVSDVSSSLTSRTAEMSADIYGLIVREIPQLRGDKRVLTLLEASVGENVATLLHIIQHGIVLENVHAPAAAEEYARRLAQRGVPASALLRAYRIGSARFQDWFLEELGSSTDNASIVSAAALRIADVTSAYIDKVSEELLSAYEAEKEGWLRNRGVARAARVQALLRGERVDMVSSEAILGYRLRQYHVGVVCWSDKATSGGGALGGMEQATAEMARQAGLEGRPIFLPQDESSAWAWLPLGSKDAFPSVCAVGAGSGIRFALGVPGSGVPGFRRTHEQALGAHAVALAAGGSGQPMTGFADVAPLALMSGSAELIRAWVIETLGPLAADDGHHAMLRDTLRVFLQESGSFMAAAERLTLHKNTVRYRIGKAEESLGRPVGEGRLQIELALLAAQWLGSTVLRQVGPPRL
jgi:DNA-binding PucR family transcriptional regulator